MSYKSCLRLIGVATGIENLCRGVKLKFQDFGGGDLMTFMYTLHGLQFCPRGQVCDYIEVQMPPHSLTE